MQFCGTMARAELSSHWSVIHHQEVFEGHSARDRLAPVLKTIFHQCVI